MQRGVLLALGMALFAGCAGAPPLPPKAGPDQVDFYDLSVGLSPPEGYEGIGPVQVQVDPGTEYREIHRLLRAEAAKLGADAIILQSIRSNAEGQVGVDFDRPEKLIGRALAIYWPVSST
ncbi:MAG: hypothetical protein ABFS34_16130 [Gemmatimonadota bacterium]